MSETVKSSIQSIKLESITVSHNPRWPIRNLQIMGYDPIRMIHDYALSKEKEKQDHFVELIESHEPEIVALATDLLDCQIMPVLLRNNGTKLVNDVPVTRYGLVDGERRFLAMAYNKAKHGKPNFIDAKIKKLTVDEAEDIAIRANLHRSDMMVFEKARIYDDMARKNQISLAEVARRLNMDYHTLYNDAVLVRLPAERKQQLIKLEIEGKLNVVAARKEALKSIPQQNANGEDATVKKDNKSRGIMKLKEVRNLFDSIKMADLTDEYLNGRLEALAEVMLLSVDEAIKLSDKKWVKEQ